MTWEELAERISKLPDEQKQTDVTIVMGNSGEVIGILDFVSDWSSEISEHLIDYVDGVLDHNHPYITVDWE